MEPAPGDKTSEWRATLLALLALPGFGAAMAIFKDALLARPWPFVALAGIGAAVAAVYVVCRTWLKGRGVATVAALLVLMLAAPAHADGPQLRAPLPADVPAVVQPAPDVSEAARVQAALAAFAAGLVSAQNGIVATPILKPWSETKAGQIVLGCVAGAIVATSAGATTAGMLATWPR